MTYALVEKGVVVNLIWLYPGNAGSFPGAVALEGRPVQMGDLFENGVFTRDGNPVQTPLEEARTELCDMAERMIDLEIQNAFWEMGVNPSDG